MIQEPFFKRARTPRSVYLGLSAVLLVSACASTPVSPTADLQSAEQAIAAADQARIADSNSPELSEAREKLAAARVAERAEHMSSADRLALEARADAELASANSQASKDQAVNDQIIKGTGTLSQEMQRNKGSTP